MDAQLTVNWSDLGNEFLDNDVSVTMTNTGNIARDYIVNCTIGESGWNLIYNEVQSGETIDVIFENLYMGGNLASHPLPTYDVVITVRDRETFDILSTITGTLTIQNPTT